jgi:two-component system response regulator YesN
MRITRKSSLFRKFLISYLVILIIPNIAGYVSYQTSINMARTSSIENSFTMLEQSEKILERRMDEVAGFTKLLAINKDLNVLMSENRQGSTYNVFGYWRTTRDIADYSKVNDYFENFYIYFNKHDVVLTPKSVYYRPEHFYSLYHYEDETYEDWKNSFLQATHERHIIPMRPYMDGNRQTSVIAYAQSLPLNNFGNPHATVVVLVDEQKISSLLESMTSHYGGWAFISDEAGRTLSAEGITTEEIAALQLDEIAGATSVSHLDNGFLLIQKRSKHTGWVYTAGIPREALMENANRIKSITWSLSAAAIMAGLIVGLLLAYRNTMPIQRLLNVFKGQNGLEASPAKNEYDFLSGSISKLILNNKQLQADLDQQIPLLRDAYFKRLVTGEFNSPKEIEDVGAQAGIQLMQQHGMAGIIKINGYGSEYSKQVLEELSVARLIVKQFFQEMTNEYPMVDQGSDKIVILFLTEEAPGPCWKEELTQLLKLFSGEVYRESGLSLTMAMGNAYHSLSDINRSYDEAKQALEYAVYLELSEPTWFQDLTSENTMFYYPLDMEQRLINTIKAGETEEARRILAQIFQLNFAERELSYEMTEQLIGEMKGTLFKLIDLKGLQGESFFDELRDKIIQIQVKHGLEQVRCQLESMVSELSDLVTKRQHDLHHETIAKIITCIESEYSDSELTLSRIAQLACLSEKYVSHLFKEHTGVNISDYVENVRMIKATELLINGHLTIDEIALQVGYNSAHAFRRAFKKVKGDSPSKYRAATI